MPVGKHLNNHSPNEHMPAVRTGGHFVSTIYLLKYLTKYYFVLFFTEVSITLFSRKRHVEHLYSLSTNTECKVH